MRQVSVLCAVPFAVQSEDDSTSLTQIVSHSLSSSIFALVGCVSSRVHTKRKK